MKHLDVVLDSIKLERKVNVKEQTNFNSLYFIHQMSERGEQDHEMTLG